MIKKIIENNDTVTVNQKEISVLREYFPQCFKEDGVFDIIRFSNLLKDKVDIIHEGYELNFLGKSYAKLLSSVESTTIIKPDLDHNTKPENKGSENIYISGDNLDGLKHLLKSYAKKVKCIYIDPPYNTGSDGFVYNDKFNFSTADLEEKLSIDESQAKRIVELTSKGSSSHSAWLMFMYPRLQLARDLLCDEGVIFISIDDNEQANLKLLCDDVFGEESCLGCIVRSTGQTTGQDSGGLGSSFDYILVYARKPDIDLSGLPLNSHDLKRFDNEDENGKYAYDQLRKTGSNDRREDRPNMYYPILNPDGEELYPVATAGYESCWRVEKKTYEKLVEENYILWKKTLRNGKEVWWPYVKYYLEGRTKRPSPLWIDLDGNKKATRDVRALFDGIKMFDYVKPVELIKRIIQIAPHSSTDDIIVDFFAGSATTAQAVMELNAKDNGNRKYILIQLPENLDISIPNKKIVFDYLINSGNPGTLDYVGIERIIRSAKKINKENPDAKFDSGFQHYTLYEPNSTTLDKIYKFEKNTLISDETILNVFGRHAVLTTWMISDGYGFTAKAEEVNLGDYIAYYCGKHLYFIDPGLSTQAIINLFEKYDSEGSFNPENIVLFGYSFNEWRITEMLDKNIKLLNDTEKNLKINIDIRY